MMYLQDKGTAQGGESIYTIEMGLLLEWNCLVEGFPWRVVEWRWNASCSTLFATEQACNWRNITEFVCIAAGGCFTEREIHLPGAKQRIALNVDVLGKKHGRMGC